MTRERKQKPMLMWSELTDSCYVVLRYKHLGNNNFEALEKYDVTQDFLRLVERFNRNYSVKSETLMEETHGSSTIRPGSGKQSSPSERDMVVLSGTGENPLHRA